MPPSDYIRQGIVAHYSGTVAKVDLDFGNDWLHVEGADANITDQSSNIHLTLVKCSYQAHK
jgi:hypothetical protein